MNRRDSVPDILRKESVRILLERFQGDMMSKMDAVPIEEPVSEHIEEQLDNAYVNRKGVPLAMDIFKPKVDPDTELPVIIVIHVVGGVGVHFAKEIKETAESLGLSVGNIVESPMAGLIEYHKTN